MYTNGVSAETLVSLGNHRALPIKMLYDQLHNGIHTFVDPKAHNNIIMNDPNLEYNLDVKGLQTWSSDELIYKDEQDCVELTMSDGRKLICTADQQVLTTLGWKRVDELVVNCHELHIGMDLPRFISNNEDLIEEKNWSFIVGNYTFKMNDDIEISKSLAFSRLLGYIITDGTVPKNNYEIVIYLGSLIDVHTMINDIYTIFNIYATYRYYNGCYLITLNSNISRTISKEKGILPGARICQDSHVPEFMLTAPRLLVAHFFQGCLEETDTVQQVVIIKNLNYIIM